MCGENKTPNFKVDRHWYIGRCKSKHYASMAKIAPIIYTNKNNWIHNQVEYYW